MQAIYVAPQYQSSLEPKTWGGGEVLTRPWRPHFPAVGREGAHLGALIFHLAGKLAGINVVAKHIEKECPTLLHILKAECPRRAEAIRDDQRGRDADIGFGGVLADIGGLECAA